MKLYTITQAELDDVQHMRNVRNQCVFSIINRGKLWYDNLTEQQLSELQVWYNAWLDFPQTKIIPQSPQWLVDEIDYEVTL